MAIFLLCEARTYTALLMLYIHLIGNQLYNTMVVFKMRDSVPIIEYVAIGGFRAGKLRNVNWKRLHDVISLVGKRVSE